VTLGGAYVTKTSNYDVADDVDAMKFTAEKKDLFGIPLTVGGRYASITNTNVKEDSSFMVR